MNTTTPPKPPRKLRCALTALPTVAALVLALASSAVLTLSG